MEIKKQSAVQWLREMLIDNKYLLKDAEHLFVAAEEKHKEQIVDAWYSCGESFITEEFDNADQYYNETFKSE